MTLKLAEADRDALVAYLATRPFAEVEQGIVMLRNLRKEDEKPIEKVEEKK